FLDQPDRLEFELSAKCSSRSQLLTPVSSSHFNKVSTGTAAAHEGGYPMQTTRAWRAGIRYQAATR
ncbi:hypothetical protein, partial [Cupriavidus campinensis]|uniref:hypothetical protein n=1 Tax=Cupriavidus campinensis TaxID=151783 RepID=UPI001C9208AD